MSALVCIVTFASVFTQTERPPKLGFDQRVDYAAWFNELVRKGKKENSLDLYLAVRPSDSKVGSAQPDRLPVFSDEEQDQYFKAEFRLWDAAEYPALAKYLKSHSKGLAAFEKATEKKHFWKTFEKPDEPLVNFTVEPLLVSRAGMRAVMSRAWLKPDASAKTILQAERIILRNASHMKQSDVLIGGLVAIASRSAVYPNLLAALDARLISQGDIKKAYQLARKEDPGPLDWPLLVQVEWAFVLSVLQEACPSGNCTAERWKEHLAMLYPDGNVPADEVTKFADADPKLAVQQIDEFFKACLPIVKRPVRLKRAAELAKTAKEHLPDDEKHIIARTLCTNLARGYELDVRGEATRRGTMLTLAIHLHHGKHGSWPKTLKDIDEKMKLGGLKTYRVDPYSGTSFVYHPDKEGFKLYSVGVNGKDDGGIHDQKFGEGAEKGDYVFWPFQRANK